jgi:hypothetical protein
MTLEQQDYFLIFELMAKDPGITIKQLKNNCLVALTRRPSQKLIM